MISMFILDNCLIFMFHEQTADTPEDAEVDISWYPKEKLTYVQRKLRGDNPCYITRYGFGLGVKIHNKILAFTQPCTDEGLLKIHPLENCAVTRA